MADWEEQTRVDYERKGFADRSGYGVKPALLVVDFINGFTDPDSPLGGDFSAEVDITLTLLKAFREQQLPVFFTTVVYESDLRDGGIFIKKVPSLGILTRGSNLVEVDRRIAPILGEPVLEKKFASAFFGTDLNIHLQNRSVDTLIVTGCTTSGCVRASAIDSMQNGYYTIVVEDAVGDRAAGPHQANLFDLDAKYADVVPSRDVLEYLSRVSPSFGEAANESFRRWWAAGSVTS